MDIGVSWGLPWHAVGFPLGPMAVAAGFATVPPMACRAPPSACHGILCHAMGCRGDPMVYHGWYHGNATACPRKKKLHCVEPCNNSNSCCTLFPVSVQLSTGFLVVCTAIYRYFTTSKYCIIGMLYGIQFVPSPLR